MERVSWDDYRFFLAVVRHRTLSAAARALDVTQPTVGRRIEALQSRVGALFDRDGSNLVVTPLGQEILAFVEEMERQHAAVHRCVERERVEGQASIRVTTTFGLATRWLAPLLEEFRTSAPELSFAVQTGIPLADLLHREADIAIRMGTPGDDQLVGTRVGRVGCGLYAAERYLEEHGHPTSLEALANHHIVESEGEIADLVQVRALRRFTAGAASTPAVSRRNR